MLSKVISFRKFILLKMINNLYIFMIILTLSMDFCTSKVHYEHIFDESALCEFYDPRLPKNIQKFYVTNKLYRHKEEVFEQNVTLHFYPCRKKKIPNCDEKSAVCLIINQNGKKESVYNFGQSFQYLASDTERHLKSIGGDLCTSSENYTLTIKFTCNEEVSLHLKNKCNWIFEMQDYTSCKQPYYTSTMDNNIVNLKSLGKANITHNGNRFFVNFFNKSEECGPGVSVCEINNKGEITPLTDVISQTTEYDAQTNKLTIKGHHAAKESRKKITTIIHIKCNWTIETVSNGKYIESASSKKYNFEVESPLACIKLPLNCLIMDRDNNLMYNISGLNKPHEGWSVANYNSGIMKINVCGPLNLDNKENSTCNVEFSQICLKETINGTNKYTNLGSIPLNFQVDEDRVKGKFVEGSKCPKNGKRTISTEIEFICDTHENGPKFENYVDDCTYRLTWKTPIACPVLYYRSEDNCKFNDLDLSGLHNVTYDTILELEDSSHLRYNLCGSLTQKCNNDSNVSVCWIKNGMEFPVGYTSQTLVQTNELLSLNLDGQECGDSRYTTKINFVCNYSVSLQGKVLDNQIIIGNCKFEITIATPLACRRSHKNMDCSVNSNIGNFNLTSLTKLDNDYYFKDHNEPNITYILNVCSPITNPLCLPDSAICMVNYTNPHLLSKYKQIGLFNSPVLEYHDETLHLNYTFGGTCSLPEKYRSIITFTCLMSSDKSEGPTLVNKTKCFYEFQWKTKYACLDKTKNIIPNEEKKDKNNVLPSNNYPIVIPTTEKPTSTSSPSSINTKSKKAANSIVVTHEMYTPTIKPTPAKLLMPQNCTIKNNETNYILNLTFLETIQIKSGQSNYSLAFNRLLNLCNGFICKNEQLVMPLMDICPAIIFNYTKSMIKLSYTSEGCSNGKEFKSDIWLKCNSIKDIPSILKATDCFIELVYPTNLACLLLQKRVIVASSTGVAVGSSVGCIILVIFLIGGFIFFRKRQTNYFTRICYQRIPSDKANMTVYCKDTTV